MKASGRKALQPRNIFVTTIKEEDTLVKPKAAEELLKENLKQSVETIDASLAEELRAFKKKLERQREDRERTEKLLNERDGFIDVQMSHLLQRGDTQKTLEIQVDRLFRLKELHAYSSKISPMRSLRDKEHEKMRRFSFVINAHSRISISVSHSLTYFELMWISGTRTSGRRRKPRE
ncbi:hypothetical protein CARUB_v10012722mg [Capsella rubella]|uniref:Uncharacterized protein n=1 Tax=Capsella rubella TaxID=81985 RepID=R0GIW7_9BRAS|nr:hypothetical protein CARUB_v10012722mg [Capsella rubella]